MSGLALALDVCLTTEYIRLWYVTSFEGFYPATAQDERALREGCTDFAVIVHVL